VDDCVGESALEYDGHADPHIHAAEEDLLVLLVLPCVVKKDSMEEFQIIELRDFYQLHGALAIAADRGLLFLISAAEEGVDHVFSWLEVLDLFVCVADVALAEGEDVGVVG
jgi:hypothetical protein